MQGRVTDRSQIERWASLVKAVPEVEYVGVDLAVRNRAENFRRVSYPTMPKWRCVIAELLDSAAKPKRIYR